MSAASIFRRHTPSRRGTPAASLAVGLLAAGWAVAGIGTAQTESLTAIRAAAEDFVRSQLPRAAQGVHAHAEHLDSRLRLPRCTLPLSASLGLGAELRARTTVKVSCGLSPASWMVYVPVALESEVPVLVLRQSAARGARLNSQQVASEMRTVSGLAVGYFTDALALAHHTLARALPAGAVLTTDDLVPDYLVRQGQQVTLVAAQAGIEVRAAGKALEDGREGARIRAQNLASLKVVQGVVDSTGVIDVTP